MSVTKFSYYYRLPPSATLVELTELYPSDGELDFSIDKKDFRYNLTLSSQLTAIGSSYVALKALLDTDPCDEVELVIQYDSIEVWYGQLNLRKAEWNPRLCQVSLQADTKNNETCLTNNWETEENIFLFGSNISVQPFFGTLTEKTCGPVNNGGPLKLTGFFETNVSGCLEDIDAYAYKRLYIEEISPTSYDHYAVWVTEQATTTCVSGSPVSPPGDGWVLLVNDCAGSGEATWGRKPQTKFTGEVSATSGKYWDQRYEVVGAEATEYDNGRLLSSILTGLVADCGYTVKSDFFGINAPGTAPSNAAYTAASSIKNIVVYQKSDIKRPNALSPANSGLINLKDLLEYLQQMFNAYWTTEDDGATLRLEHISYFDGANGIDLTSIAPANVANRNAFSFNLENLVPRDQYKWMDRTVDVDFRGRDIIYPAGCADADRQAQENVVREVFTDLGAVIDNTDAIDDAGFFFMSADEISGLYYMNRETAELSNEIKPNAHLSWANLHENYLSWGRPVPAGNLNGQNVTFNSYIRTKKQEQLEFAYSATDFFNLSFAEKIKSEIGWGEVETATYSAKSCILIIELLHEE